LEVEEVTNSSYFHHFRDILENQENFQGSAYGNNNWRDTSMKRSFGRTILQHRASLLKLMLLASTEDLDFMLSVQFAEREYNRFKNKYIQLVNTYVNDITQNSLTASSWFDNALTQINLGKPKTFPFYNSGCGGSHTFIPPTASFLGVAKTYKPEFYYDTSFATPAWVIRGHDNSQFIMYGEHDGTEFTDKRDEAILEFEQRIYNTIPNSYKGGNLIDYLQPEFLIGELFPGKFRTTDYTREEVNKLSRPMFERWAASKGIDYRTNNTYEQSNKFTWNYGTASDIDGGRVPGNWRGIYKWYFDTDRPNTHPWEMLGFSEKPDYWDARYGNAPYTGANQLMWNDLEQGYIADGIRAGTSAHFARPGLGEIIPVDSTGELLDPFTARIIPNLIPEPQASAVWEFGDMGPIENVWAKTEFYGIRICTNLILNETSSVC